MVPAAQALYLSGASSPPIRCRLKNSAGACHAFRPPVRSGGAGTTDEIELAPNVTGASST